MQTENIFLTHKGYRNFCTREYTDDTTWTCAAPKSPLVMFYGPPDLETGYPATVLAQTTIDEVLRLVLADQYQYGSAFGKDLTAESLGSSYARAMYKLGLPGPGFKFADKECAFPKVSD